jgi:hypothetical protein
MRLVTLLRGLLAASLMVPLAAGAQADEVQWYAVEVVFFDQRGAVADDGERWPVVPSLPSADTPVVTINDTSTIRGFRGLAADGRQLNGIRRKLANTGGYKVLAHIGWRQPGLARDAAPGIALPLDWRPDFGATAKSLYGGEADTDSSGGPSDGSSGAEQAPNPFVDVPSGTRLFGTVRAYRERHLHLELDLRFSPNGWSPADTVPVGLDDYRGDTNSGMTIAGADATTASPTTYVVQQKRRLRSSELHYLDHPVIGMVATIEPVATPDDAEAPPPEVLANED